MKPVTIMIAGVLALAGCAPSGSKEKAPDAAAAPAPFNTKLSTDELMAHVIDPASFAVWRSSGEVVTFEGAHSLVPTTDEGWAIAENGAAQVAEAGNLLMLPTRARDNGDWMKFSRQLTEAGLAAMAAAEAKDGDKMFQTGADLYQVCVACHEKYYLPFYKAPAEPGETAPKK